MKLVEQRLSAKRAHHVICVWEQALKMAARFGEDPKKTGTAALLHDITKEVPLDEQLKMLQKFGIINDNVILKSPSLYHAITGALYAERELGITDADILAAVRYHTTARAGMSRLEQIIYLADAVSADRTYKQVEKFRRLAMEDLDLCMLEMLKHSIRYLVKDECLLPADTLQAYNQYCEMDHQKGR
ncbi:putative nicotinate-nucleotide adenylyltransferase [uncultured Ruminococcus sp.]|nr:putative nicotinate-nucleotide adenylyltransferase [uncultured Ruminococcus sp.]SCH77926.1 putative nicotinate-nucleotide adenylyltransferase [uncultured Clostridium sp.]